MRRAASLLFVLLTAPFAAAMEVPSSSTAAVRVSTPPAGVSAAVRLEEDYRRARARVQRARRALKKAEADGGPGVREAREELALAQEALNGSREKMRAALKAGSVSPEYAALKKSVRDDLNAVRRARYALDKARRRSDAKGIVEAEHRLREAKGVLKEHRARMRSLLRKR